jgi:phosphate-selective porin
VPKLLLMNLLKVVPITVLISLNQLVVSQIDTNQVKTNTLVESNLKKTWYESFQIRGYAQIRYNRLLETNPELSCEQCDRSWGGENGFFMRRMRIIFFGQINKNVYFYIQPDFASSASSSNLHFAQIRDAYFDVSLDKKTEFRFRIGQSKVPFGFENMQSSQNRLPLDRNDALNSAVSNERDIGVFFYWVPLKKRKLYSSLVADGLKGSGDYGLFGIGAYNGQTANKPELNDNKHVAARISYPFEIKNQVFEPGIQAYTGQYVIPNSSLSPGVKINENRNYKDERIAGSFILYPKPFGIQAEYNIGRGPEFNKFTDSIEVRSLKGGYATLSYLVKTSKQSFYPFIRYHAYEGGKKHELDARSYRVKEIEFGIEWLPVKQFELVIMYTMSSRRFEDYSNQENYQRGNLLRIQAQVNF